jgi:glycosyltransferase involved in cell wall biosynthesis
MHPFFSVVIPTYNRKCFLKKSIESVLSQNFKDYELIIVDDGSTDSSIHLVADYSGMGLSYIKTGHHGVSHARNTGILNSRGSYIAFLDSDDRWENNKLEDSFKYIRNLPEINIFHTDEIWYRKGKILGQKAKHKRPSGYIYEHCLPLCCIGMSTLVVKKSLFNEIGIFDENLPVCEDYDFFLRATLENEVKLISSPLTIKEGGRDDQLSNQPGLDKYRIYSLEKMLNSGLLSEKNSEITIKELETKCTIYAKGAEKRGRIEEAKKYFNKIEDYN